MSVADAALSSRGTLSPFVNHAANITRWKTKPRYWTQDEEDRLVQLREVEGFTAAAIAPMMNRTVQSVSAKIERMGLQLPHDWQGMRGWGSTLSAGQLAQAKRFWMRGDRIADAAKALKLHEPRVARAYRQFSEEEAALPAVPTSVGVYIGAKEMMAIVAPICGVRASAITGRSRLRPLVCARIAIARALADRGLSTSIIARALSRGDHTTAINWLRKFQPYCHTYPETLRAYEAIKRAEQIVAERRAA